MISTSANWKTWSANYGTFHIKATIDNGTTLNLTDEDFMQGSVSFTDSISGMNDIKLGAVVTNSFSATLNNFGGKFSNYNLAGAILTVQYGIIYTDSTEEWINRGTYIVDRPMSIGNTIKIEAYDYMDKLNKYLNGITGLTFPMTGKALIQAICTYCGVTFGTWSANLNTGTISVLTADMFDASTTCRQAVSWVLETVGGYARMNPTNNRLDCKQFGIGIWATQTDIVGGTMSSWTTGTAYDGGTMNPWNSTTLYNGGLMSGRAFQLSSIKNESISLENFYVTGVKVIPYQSDDENEFATAGSGDRYVITIENNPLINSNNMDTVASAIWMGINGLMIRPFNANIFGDPSYEAGDIIDIVDHNGASQKSIITNMQYTLPGNMRLSCDAETVQERSADYADKFWYTNNKLAILESSLESQIDGKIETWVQADRAPSDYWFGSTIRNKHAGDLWLYTGTSNLTINEGTVAEMTIEPSKTYRYLGESNLWEEYEVPDKTLFDLADGKTTIYYGTTSQYLTVAEDGDYLVDSTNGCTYKFDSSTTVKWVKQIDYAGELEDLREDLVEQIDAKIETFAQVANPNTWSQADRAKHNGDLWYYTGLTDIPLYTGTADAITIKPSKTYQYNSTTNKWVAYSVPAESLFDFADGKSTIFYGTTSGTYDGVARGDYLVDSVSGMTYKRNDDNDAWVALIASPVINLLPTTYYRENVSGAGAWTSSGITWTLKTDGSIMAGSSSGSQTATSTSMYALTGSDLTMTIPCITVDPNQRYFMSGCPSGGKVGNTTYYRIRVRCTQAGTTPSGSTGSLVYDTGDGVLLPANTKYIYTDIQVLSGTTLSSPITFYPMLEVGTARHNYVSTHANTTSQISSSITTYDNSLDQLKVYKKLTNDGASQGLFMDTTTGDFYMNATYINTGTLSADRIGAGTIAGAVEATNLTLKGGAIQMTSSSATSDWIQLSKASTSSTPSYSVGASPTDSGIKYFVNAGLNYRASFQVLRNISGSQNHVKLEMMSVSTSNTQVGEASLSSNGNAFFTGTCSATTFSNISSEEKKRSIEPYKDSALDKIKATDIYTYSYENEKKGANKHIGLVIGEKYNTPKELVVDTEGEDAQGIDLYAMISMAWKAIQEQQEKIESLEKRVAELEKESK